MCGITGFIDYKRQKGVADLAATVTRLTGTLRHRGPDDGGIWVDEEVGVALGQRRLSIVDLSHEGHQPMLSSSGRYVIVFNGEVFNFMAIRRELEAVGKVSAWRGYSDTEVMLAAIECWGLTQAVVKFNGMFAFALWDREECKLYLVRDKVGIKPLYYGCMGGTFLFGSELKALVIHPDFKKKINLDALAVYLRHSYIPAPYSIYQGIYKLLPGSILSLGIEMEGDINRLINPGTYRPAASPNYVPFWSAKMIALQGQADPCRLPEDETLAYLENLLLDTVRLHMVADVPLGAFLSGGVDSSLVVALMQAQSTQRVKTFTIGFYDDNYNEAKYAKEVAYHLGTDHTELYVSPEEAMAVIPKLPVIYDEPFADSSQIPTFLVSELAQRSVTVSLSGDGGDELFCGYDRYFKAQSIWHKIGWVPSLFKKALAASCRYLSPQAWDVIFSRVARALPERFQQHLYGYKLHMLADILSLDSREALYLWLISHWKEPVSLISGAQEPLTALTDHSNRINSFNFESQMMYLDLITYLPDDILTKVDRASMAVSLEVRVPLLDYRVVESSWNLPLDQKIRNGQGKWLMRQILYKYMPRKLIERPKMGFGIPIDKWLKGPLRDWAEDLLSEDKLKRQGFFSPEPVRRLWNQHLRGARNWQYHLWDILMFQSWLAKWGEMQVE